MSNDETSAPPPTAAIPAKPLDGAQPNRTPPPFQPVATRGASSSRPIVVSGLYLASLAFFITGIIGLILAYVWREEEDSYDWENTHFTYLIRTFWIGLLIMVVGVVVFIGGFLAILPPVHDSGEPPIAFIGAVMAGGIVLLLGTLWAIVRCLYSLIKAASGRPVSRPMTWLI